MMGALGLDIGGVIMDGVKEDRAWHVDPPAIEGAFAAIARLSRERFPQACWLVSRCEAAAEPVILNWLERRGFFLATGIDRKHVVFCRAASEKAKICRELDITHFVDDRLAVLEAMIEQVPNLYWFLSRASESRTSDSAIEGIRTVQTWTEITDELLDPCTLSKPAADQTGGTRHP